MKKYLVVFGILIFNISFGQTHNPLNYYNNGWNILGYQIDTNTSFPGITDRYKFYFYGDSIINSNYYHKCYYDFERYNSTILDMSPSTTFNFTGMFRNVGLQYYFLPEDSTSERLVYDFSLNVGDTIPTGYDSRANSNLFKVIGFANPIVLLDNSIRTKYYYDYYDSNGNIFGGGFYYDGIGDIAGLIDFSLFEIQDYDGGTETFTYCENGSLLFKFDYMQFPSGQDCNFPVSIKENLEAKEIAVYPNPTEGFINIDLNNNNSKVAIKILDFHGKVLINRDYYNSGVVNLNLSTLQNGIYFILIKSDENQNALKIVKNTYKK